jgi:hypothetical protein
MLSSTLSRAAETEARTVRISMQDRPLSIIF